MYGQICEGQTSAMHTLAISTPTLATTCTVFMFQRRNREQRAQTSESEQSRGALASPPLEVFRCSEACRYVAEKDAAPCVKYESGISTRFRTGDIKWRYRSPCAALCHSGSVFSIVNCYTSVNDCSVRNYAWYFSTNHCDEPPVNIIKLKKVVQ